GSGGESIKRLASSASLRGLVKLQPGRFNLRQFVERPFMQFAKWLLKCSTKVGDLILDCYGRERDDLAQDETISFQPPQALCKCLLSYALQATPDGVKAMRPVIKHRQNHH